MSDPRLRSEDRGFFTIMTNIQQNKTEAEETPTVEEKVESKPVVDEPAETVSKTETTEKVAEPENPRAAYNCEVCKGEGLQDERNLCPACLGTGKRLN